MGAREATIDGLTVVVGETSTTLVAPDTVFRELRNLVQSDEGGLVSVTTPLPYVTKLTGGGGPPTNGTPDPGPTTIVYGPTHGCFQAHVQGGEREIVLLHTDRQIWEFKGWTRGYRVLVGDASDTPVLNAKLPTPMVSDFPTQWCATPTGVVIVPQGGRAYFYDGVAIAQLGYDGPPSPPVGLGPESTANSWFPDGNQFRLGINDGGYAMDSLTGNLESKMPDIFRYGRLGTVDTPGNVSVLAEEGQEDLGSQVMGYLLPYRARCRSQFVDRWGNLSPPSPPSNEVRFARQPSQGIIGNAGGVPLNTTYWLQPECVRKQVAWDAIVPGPPGTIGRILYRTRDLENSGSIDYYEVPRDSSPTPTAFATLPDNISSTFPDNIPDAWLVNQMPDVIPVPEFKLCTMFAGRLFMANVRGDEGVVYWSEPGRWGTIVKGNRIHPDPTAAAVTGMHRVNGGLIVTTARSTFLMVPNDSGAGFRSSTLHPTAGGVAPSSFATHRNGMAIWLGRDGFYAHAGGQVEFLFELHRHHARRMNRTRMHKAVATFDPIHGEYRCWVAYDGSPTNNLCFTFDGTSWRVRDDIAATGVCTSDDSRSVSFASGIVGGLDGLWVLDHGGDPAAAVCETAWIRSTRSKERSSVRSVNLWLRETGGANQESQKILVEASVNYRAEIVSSARVNPLPLMHEDYGPNPDLWDIATYGAGSTWRTRRPYWARCDLDLPSCETFRLRITSSRRVEILGYSFEEKPRSSGGAQNPR